MACMNSMKETNVVFSVDPQFPLTTIWDTGSLSAHGSNIKRGKKSGKPQKPNNQSPVSIRQSSRKRNHPAPPSRSPSPGTDENSSAPSPEGSKSYVMPDFCIFRQLEGASIRHVPVLVEIKRRSFALDRILHASLHQLLYQVKSAFDTHPHQKEVVMLFVIGTQWKATKFTRMVIEKATYPHDDAEFKPDGEKVWNKLELKLSKQPWKSIFNPSDTDLDEDFKTTYTKAIKKTA
ncbi:hypothetical protein BJ138DRAFT_1110472 [Hygrophoropsis aurantiaca]|uniref:Uncharacterized protein n=1 Tax=Hygrophoropsis aurantiaca TaxID=72124 RepID=A0ACB8ALW9_9AGAM|nr:hypothetical protein BJ138DRAFT_1110472 [Hygrophoropsis aurantiaca]